MCWWWWFECIVYMIFSIQYTKIVALQQFSNVTVHLYTSTTYHYYKIPIFLSSSYYSSNISFYYLYSCLLFLFCLEDLMLVHLLCFRFILFYLIYFYLPILFILFSFNSILICFSLFYFILFYFILFLLINLNSFHWFLGSHRIWTDEYVSNNTLPYPW